jgi:hypothetical protein
VLGVALDGAWDAGSPLDDPWRPEEPPHPVVVAVARRQSRAIAVRRVGERVMRGK